MVDVVVAEDNKPKTSVIRSKRVGSEVSLLSLLSETSKTEFSLDGSLQLDNLPANARRLSWGAPATRKEKEEEEDITSHIHAKRRSSTGNFVQESRNEFGPETLFGENKVFKIHGRELRNAKRRSYMSSMFPADLKQLLNITQDEMNDSRVSNQERKTATKGDIRFTKLEIREYPICPGDNPGGFFGPPLTMSWDYTSSTCTTVDKYEDIRKFNRRSFHQLKLPAKKRSDILRELGYNRSEIQAAVRTANLERNRRKASLSKVEHDHLYEQLEKLKTFLLKILTFGQKGKKKKKYLMMHVPSYCYRYSSSSSSSSATTTKFTSS